MATLILSGNELVAYGVLREVPRYIHIPADDLIRRSYEVISNAATHGAFPPCHALVIMRTYILVLNY